MTLPLDYVRYKFTHNDETDPYLTVSSEDEENDMKKAVIKRRVQSWKDNADFAIDNKNGKYSGLIRSGDRLDVTYRYLDSWYPTTAPGTGNIGQYGGTHYGETNVTGGATSDKYTRTWSGIIEGREIEGPADHLLKMTFSASDYVFWLLNERDLYDVYEGETISDVVIDAIEQEAPEIDTSGVAEITTQTDKFCDGETLMDFIGRLADEADCVLSSDGSTLIFEPMGDITTQFELQREDFSTGRMRIDPSDVVNQLRVDGGTAVAVDDEQLTQTGYTTIGGSNNTRTTFRVDSRKSSIDRLEIWLDNNDGSQAGVNVRLQKDDGTGNAPIAINDDTSDIASKSLNYRFISNDDFTTFLMPNHTLPEPRPWVIIETTGNGAHEVGIETATGTPAYKVWYNYPVAVRLEDRESQGLYRQRDGRIKKKNLATFTAARNYGNGYLNHRVEPDQEFEFDALVHKTHLLNPAEIISANQPKYEAEGKYIVKQKTINLHENKMDTNIVTQEVSSF